MAVDGRATDGREPQAECCQARVERVRVRGGQLGQGVDARRERTRRTVQAPLLSVVPVRAVPVPLPASSYVTPRSDQDFRCRSGSWPGLPVPLAGLGFQAVGAEAGR